MIDGENVFFIPMTKRILGWNDFRCKSNRWGLFYTVLYKCSIDVNPDEIHKYIAQ
jgi:hypothetical protein